MRLVQILILAAWTGTFCPTLLASTISLQVTADVTLEEDDGICTVLLNHVGDEAAASLQTTFLLAGHRYLSEVVEILEPDSAVEQQIEFPGEHLPAGLHHGILEVAYTDLNGYPFTALAYARISKGETRSPTALVQMGDIELGEAGGSLVVRIRNLDTAPLAMQLRVVLPRELVSLDYPQTIELPGRTEQEVPVTVQNFSALVGSRYPVFAVADYEIDDLHASSLATANIEVTASPQEIDSPKASTEGLGHLRTILILALVTAFLVSAALLVRHRKG